jgi:serine/threonine protein phosphatase 1
VKEIGFIGDVHGCLDALEAVVSQVVSRVDSLVFLGDYVNKGKQSREVIQFLIDLKISGRVPCKFVKGHHDAAFLAALVDGKIDAFLRMGGAATICSYVDAPRGDLLAQVRAAVPFAHVNFLRSLVPHIEERGVYAAHDVGPKEVAAEETKSDLYHYFVYGHSPQVGLVPNVTDGEAFIDTGCGTLQSGRLTCLFWPSLDWVQS